MRHALRFPFRLGLSAALAASFAVTSARSARAQDLAPPPPIDPNSQGAPNRPQGPLNEDGKNTTQQLDDSEKKDSGRNFELFYVNADVGLSYISLDSFNASNLALQKTNSIGPAFGLGAGVRLLILTAGVRMKLNQLSAFSLWQVNGEVAFHFTESKFDPYIGVHGGYAFVGTLQSSSLDSATSSSAGDVSVHGFDAGLDLGFDYYLSSLFSIGASGMGEALFLQRPPVPIPAGLPQAQVDAIKNQPLYANSGNSAGFGAAGFLRLGLHLGI
jgi:hypothetical protein